MVCSALVRALGSIELADGRSRSSGGHEKRVRLFWTQKRRLVTRRGKDSTENGWVEGMVSVVLQKTGWRIGGAEEAVRLLTELERRDSTWHNGAINLRKSFMCEWDHVRNHSMSMPFRVTTRTRAPNHRRRRG